MKALVDADLVAYRCAASCEKQGILTEDFGVATARANNLLVSILEAVEATDRQLFLSGGENFRKKISPSYKANRDGVPRPVYLEPLREWLVTEWGASVTDGNEADDELGIAQTAAEPDTTVICSLDKDLRQVPGHHYSWEIVGTSSSGNQWKKEAQSIYVSEQEGLFNFYWQLMMGDQADNVPGYDGKMRSKVPKFMNGYYELMQCYEDEQELFDFVATTYLLADDELIKNGTCLWVQRYEGDNWLLKGKQLMSVANSTVVRGHGVDSTPSSPPLSEQVLDDGSPSTTL